MDSKLTMVFVPGAFHTPAHFQSISELLYQSGCISGAISLPSLGNYAATFAPGDDIRGIRSRLETLVEQDGKDIVLVMHSYGGVPVCQTVTGLEKSARVGSGK